MSKPKAFGNEARRKPFIRRARVAMGPEAVLLRTAPVWETEIEDRDHPRMPRTV